STLLQTICDSVPDLQIETLSVGDRKLLEKTDEGTVDPFCIFDTQSATSQVRRCRMRVSEPGLPPVNVELVDTPGIDTSNDAFWEVEQRLQLAVEEELQPRRGRDAQAALIHAVVYVVAPPAGADMRTRLDAAVDLLTAADVAALRQLAALTNVLVAVGKCDIVEAGNWALFRDGSFMRDVGDLVAPARLFAFADLPGTQPEPISSVRKYSRNLVQRMPFLLCGSAHVDEWQQMRLPEFQASRSLVDISDWRALESRHNRACASSPNCQTAAIPITRQGQRRTIALVREYPWGTLNIANPAHCDFLLLTDVLFASYRRSLVCWVKEHFYETYRMQRMAVRMILAPDAGSALYGRPSAADSKQQPRTSSAAVV
ncbi:hypothetical protein IWW55_006625, partial [Coemansia sp. RSA 2706]